MQEEELSQLSADFTWYLETFTLSEALMIWKMCWMYPVRIWRVRAQMMRMMHIDGKYRNVFFESTSQLKYSAEESHAGGGAD